jgi:hypothetical protein
MRAVGTRLRLIALVLSVVVAGCAPRAVRVDCDKHLEPINASAAGKPTTPQSATHPQISPSPKRTSADGADRQDSAP